MKVTPDGMQRDQYWYRTVIGADLHASLVPYMQQLLRRYDNRHSKNRARERIYEGIELTSSTMALSALETYGVGIARLNASKSIIDTFTSRLSKDRPMPAFDVDGENYDLKRQAREFKKLIVGQMLETEFDDLSRECLLDGGILGNGFTRIDNYGGDGLFAERVHVNEMLFDDRESRYGKPQQGFRVHRVAVDYLLELFPGDDFRRAIMESPPSRKRPDDNYDYMMVGDLADYRDVYEGWYLPPTPDSESGRHGLCVDRGTLVSERWYEPRFPWAMLRLFKPRVGLWGNGFIDQLAPLQHRVNCMVRDLQLNLAATGRGHFLVNEQNDIPVEQLSGFMPFKMKFKGSVPPTWQAPQPFHNAQLDALKFFIQQMFDLTGVSQAAATSKSSLGPGASGIALDTQYDIDSDRFRMPQSNYARYRLDGAQGFIDASCRCARARENDKGKKRSWVAVGWSKRDAIERLDYDKVALKEGAYRMRIEAVNFLPDTRAGKLAVVEQLAKAGVIPQWIVPTLFDEPDMVEANNLVLAPFRACMKKMDILLNVDEEIPGVEDFNDLELELKIVVAYQNYMSSEKAPPEIMQRFAAYKDQVRFAVGQKNKPDETAMPVGAPPGGPMAPATGGAPPMPGGGMPPSGPLAPAAQPIGAPNTMMPSQMAAV